MCTSGCCNFYGEGIIVVNVLLYRPWQQPVFALHLYFFPFFFCLLWNVLLLMHAQFILYMIFTIALSKKCLRGKAAIFLKTGKVKHVKKTSQNFVSKVTV